MWRARLKEQLRSSSDVWQQALAVYTEHSLFHQDWPIAQIEQLAREICYATKWISLANWVVWLILEQRTFPTQPECIAGRIDELVRLAGREN